DSTINMTMAGGYTVQLGDFRSTAGITNQTSVGTMLLGFKRLGDPKYAQIVYYLKGGNLDNVYIDIFEKNAEDIQDEIRAVIEQYGEYKFESRNKTGFGLAVLSGGELVKGSNAGKNSDFRRDSWLWYGRTDKSHGHWDMLSMGIDAYGFNFTPDLGYPDATLFSGKKYQWVQNTLSHNTVVVDGDWQKSVLSGRPLHFDDSGIVKVVDAEAPHAYDQTDIYRRTLVSVDASGEVAYTVDFFRIKGGSEHIYSFHTQSQDGVTTDDLTLVKQVDKDGNYIGTYAGPDTEYGDDPATDISVWYCETMYPRGYTYLKNVSRDEAPESGEFSVNFKQTDFKKQVVSDKGLNLKFTALNDWTPSSVGFAAGEPPRIIQNNVIRHLDYMLIHRKAENDKQLDTLFTSVIQPYNGEEYIEAMQSIALESSGGENADDTSKAVRVTLKNGRTDYVIYATNPDITYSISDTVNGNAVEFDFEGFVGVYSVDKNGNKIYAYVNDGGKIGDLSVAPRYTGQVVSFTAEGLVPENFITVDVNEEMTAEEVSSLAGRYIYVDNAGAEYTGGNGAYKIISASVNKQNEEHIDLDIGDVTLVKAYTDNSNPSKGYRYNIEAEQTFTIPLSASQDSAPEIWVQGDITTSAGSSVTMQVSSSSPAEEKISYVGT
ncbi:MAG: heparinase II/III family protein, partial [Oscillospiraceae bacterium]|nr:heparinase II/III family protein [Oscillospiraceae bacterium]